MKDATLKRDIRAWIKDYEGMFPANLMVDDNAGTLEGDAYNLLGRALNELK